MSRWNLVAACCAAMAACNEDAPDGEGLVIETTASQPASAEFGVSLAIHARGGRGVAIAVERGSLVAPTDPGKPPATATAGCFASSSDGLDEPFTIELSVRPAEKEALLYATLRHDADCSGTLVQSHVVAVHPPATNTVDAGPDGGM